MSLEFESARDSSQKRDSAGDAINNSESLPEIIMEQEELMDSEDEFGENVEFECEEMADSEGESTSDSEQFVDMPNEEMQIHEMDGDIDHDRVLNACSTSNSQPIRLELAEKRVTNIKSNIVSLNLNSHPPVSPHSNPNNAATGYEFGPFGRNQLLARSNKSSQQNRRYRSYAEAC